MPSPKRRNITHELVFPPPPATDVDVAPVKFAVATKLSHAAIVAEGATVVPCVVPDPKNIGASAAGMTDSANVEFVPPTVVPLARTKPRGFEPMMNSVKNVRD